ncbi:Vacuolar protein sorting-associated protein 52 [Haplosporangium bisporale]|nr:Vacuolar protein sorting-associated protein 52 [Haplosporangium bisporale]
MEQKQQQQLIPTPMLSEEMPLTPVQSSSITRRNSQKRQSLTGLKFLNELLDDYDHDNYSLSEPVSPKAEHEQPFALILQDELAFEQVGDRISEFQEDEFVKQALAKGMDLREYAHYIESELDIVGQDHEDDYIHQSQAFVDLHGQIKSCDEILETMENLLSIFQNDLGNISAEIQTLQTKSSVEKIREFLLTKIKSFRIPNTNVQIMQHSVLLKYKELNQFVMERHSDVATEIRQTYANTLRWYFSNQFEHYALGLERLQYVMGDKYEMLCTDESARKGLFGTTKILHQKANVFAVSNRLDTLRNNDAGLILIHVANEKNMKYPYEALFRSFNLALIDNASSEYLFLIEYFSKIPQPDVEGIQSVFAQIFEPTLKLGLANVKEYADSSYDAIGILLCLRINHQLANELERRRIPTLDKYRDAIHMVLWPRFQVVVDMHIDSVRKAKTRIKPKNVHPHWQTDVMPRLALLRLETSSLFEVMSKTFPDTKSRLIFLINTFDLVLTLLSDVRTPGVEVENEHWKTVLHQSIALFVEEELDPYFGDLISFIKMVNISGGVSKVSLEHFERASYNFTNSWRQALLAINTSVIQHFSSFKNGTLVLHQVLGQLIVHYTRFNAMLDEKLQQLQALAVTNVNGVTTSTRGWSHQPVGVQTVMVEVKKFRSNFLP